MADSNPAARKIFLQAVEIDDGEQRRAFLDSACAADATLRQVVDGLLQVHAQAGNLMDGVAGPAGPTAADMSNPPTPPKTSLRPTVETAGAIVAGRYKLLQKLGEGGMGSVWMAEQNEPVKRMVALKLVKTGMDSDQMIARFEAERQALALMDHPNIARVLDAGTTASGRPYFVMELVKGMAITKYCDERRLSPRDRLALFIPVCQAVQHAHQKGIIHRDLKPSNVMIALYDGKPVPKVIDFGVAKAAGQKLTEHTLFTGFGAIVGTLEYMSPEQAELNQLDIDTRSDIYSLGVLVYELLAGSTPLDRKRVKDGALLEMLRAIREEEPPKPSARLSSSNTLANLSAQRQMEPAKLAKLMRGDLDWIVMKALEKDRNRRYETANGLALDIERYLKDEPVLAGPPSAAYRVRKFVKRNKGPALAAGVVALAVLGGIVGTTWGLIEARRQRDHAEKAQQDEAGQRKSAVAERDRAEKGEADAKRQQEATESQRQIADNERQQKELELERASHTAYVAQVWRAAGIWDREPDYGLDLLLDDVMCPPAKRDFTWQLYHRLCQCDRRQLPGHTDTVSCLAVSRDGKWLVSGSYDGSLKLWHLPDGELKATFNGHKDHVWCVAFTPDSKKLASASRDGTVMVWNVNSRAPLKTLTGHLGSIWCVAWTHDNKWLACGSGVLNPEDRGDSRWGSGRVVLWNPDSGSQRILYKDGRTSVISLAISPDGKTLAAGTAAEGRVKLFDLPTDKYLGDFSPGNYWNQGLTYVGNSTLAVGGSDNTVILTDRTDDKIPTSYSTRQRLRGHVNEVWWVAGSPDNRNLVSTSWDNTLRIWDVATGLERMWLRNEHTRKADEPTLAAVFSSDGKSLIAPQGTAIRLWTLPTTPYNVLPQSHKHGVLGVATSPDGLTFASASQDFSVKLWDAAKRHELATCTGHKDRVTSVAFSPDRKTLASGSWDNTVKLWQANGGQLLKTLTGHQAEVVAVAYSAGGQLFSASIDGAVFQWDIDTGLQARTFGPHKGGVSTLALSSEGKILAVADNFHIQFAKYGPGRYVVDRSQPGTATLWDVASGRKLQTLTGHQRAIVSLAFRADGLLATASWDGTVKLWNSASGAETATVPRQNQKLHAVAFSHDGKTLALAGNDRAVQLWDVSLAPRSLLQRAVLKGHSREATCLAFGKDDQYLVSGSGAPTSSWFVKGGEVLFWDAHR